MFHGFDLDTGLVRTVFDAPVHAAVALPAEMDPPLGVFNGRVVAAAFSTYQLLRDVFAQTFSTSADFASVNYKSAIHVLYLVLIVS